MKTAIVWFRNDLRLHDHPALARAIEDYDSVIPLFVFSDSLLRGKHASSNRNRFLHECLIELKADLQLRGADLVVRNGQPEQVLHDLCKATGATAIYYTADYTPYAIRRDKKVKQDLESHNLLFRSFPGRLAVSSTGDLRTKNGSIYKVFTPFWKNWQEVPRRKLATPIDHVPFPKKIDTGEIPALKTITDDTELSPDVLIGGERAARKRLKEYLKKHIDDYADQHNTISADKTSRLSPYLHFGSLSPREIETMLPDTAGARAWHRQLAWREFYNYILFHYPSNATQEFQERYQQKSWENNNSKLQAWQQGRTGYPVVDASMRQLSLEGWMHNRGRLIVGSFLTKDLLLDWRSGEAYFMQMLLDGDEANNNGNWQWIASVGVDPAPVFRRLYNPSSQQANYDPEGSFVRKYVPELARVPDTYLTEPWTMPEDEQHRSKCIIGKDYPNPIVNHSEARKAALEWYRTAAA